MYNIMLSPILEHNVSHTGDRNASWALVRHLTLTALDPSR